MEDQLLAYFKQVLLVTAARMQSWKGDKESPSEYTGYDLDFDDFGRELLDCMSGLSSQQVWLY